MMESNRSLERLEPEELAFSDVFGILFRRKWIILLTLLVCLAVGVFLSSSARKYRADGVIRIQPGSASLYRTSPNAAGGDVSDKIASEVEMLQSRTLLLKVAKDLDLQNNADFLGAPVVKHESLDDAGVRDRMVRAMRTSIEITHKPKDEIVTISCLTLSPTLSAKIVNTLINDYVEFLFQIHYGSSKRSSGWLVGQLDDLKQQIEKDQSAVTELQAKLGIIGFDEKNNDYLFAQSLNSLTKAASDATIDRIVAEAKYRFLKDADPNLIEGEVSVLNGTTGGPAQSGLLQTLRNSQATQSSEYARLLAQFGANYPDVKQQKAQLDEITRQVKAEQSRILNQAGLSYSAASANEKMTDKVLGDRKTEAFSLRRDMVKYIILLQDYQSHRTLYEGLILRLREAGITSGIEGGEIDIVDLADVPILPAPPGALTYLLGSIATGLFFGSILAFLADALSTRVATLEQARRAAGLPLLAVIPHVRGGGRDSIADQDTAYAEAIESMRSSILLSLPETSSGVLLVTSAMAREGKAMTSINLAAVLAQHGSRVLLVDCDVRHNAIASRLSLSGSVGLSHVLTREVQLDSAVQSYAMVSGLDVLVSGPRPPGTAVLMGSAQMQEMIQLGKARYDFVVLNAPPTLGLSDVLNLGHLADAVVLVVRSGFVARKALKRTREILSRAQLPVVGYAFNDVRSGFLGNGSSAKYYKSSFQQHEGVSK